MAKKTQHDKLMENFKVFRNAFFHDVDPRINQRVCEIIGQKLKKFTDMSDDVDVQYIVKSYLSNGRRIPSRYKQLYQFIEEGVVIPENAEMFEIEMRVVVRVDDMILETKDDTPFFKTKKFIVKENVDSIVAKLMIEDIRNKKTKNKLISQDTMHVYSGQRIKFGKDQVAEF